jgi:hypothetical protein
MILSYKQLFEQIKLPNIGDLVVCMGDIDDLKTHNHIGVLKRGGVDFVNRFSDKLHDLGGDSKNKNGWFIRDLEWIKPFNNNKSDSPIPLIYSNNFRDIISYSLKFLIDYENIYYSDVSYIDVTSRNETLSCLTSSNFKKLEPGEDPWTSTMRNNIRIGRFIKKIVDDSDELIEDYANEYKFSFKLNKEGSGHFKIAKGVEMAKWYLEAYYAHGGGSLHASCMKHIKSQKRLPIYTNNPDKIKLLYITNQTGKLLGRALLWKLDHPAGKTYMDRVYCTEDYIEKLFDDYARKKGFLTKIEVDKKRIQMIVKLGMDYGPPQHNPYMDTFKFFIKDEDYLTNRFRNFKAGEYWEYVDHD